MAGVVYVTLEAVDKARNPCQRVHDHYCKQDAKSLSCQAYQSLLRESVEEASGEMRSSIRHQCAKKIANLKADEGIEIP